MIQRVKQQKQSRGGIRVKYDAEYEVWVVTAGEVVREFNCLYDAEDWADYMAFMGVQRCDW